MLLSILFVLAACQQRAKEIEAPTLNIIQFSGYEDIAIETPEQIFHLSEDAISFAENAVEGHSRTGHKVQALVDAVFSRTALDLSYVADANTVADETFRSAAANCLSMTIMTYAMAKHLDLEANFQEILIPEFWTQRQGFTIINKHLNLRVKKPRAKFHGVINHHDYIIDFDPNPHFHEFEEVQLSEAQVIADFYNNKAAEHILKGERVAAFAYLLEALKYDADDEGAWLNLGAIYSQVGDVDKAIELYQFTLSFSPNYKSAYENLANAYSKIGNVEASDKIKARLHRLRLKNPFYHMILAEKAHTAENYQAAILHYLKAIKLNANPHEFYFGLAKSYYKTGQKKKAHSAMQKAISRSDDFETSQFYNQKMSLFAAK